MGWMYGIGMGVGLYLVGQIGLLTLAVGTLVILAFVGAKALYLKLST